MKLKFQSGGREISQSQFVDKIMDATLEKARKELRAKIESVRCPVHNQRAEAISKDSRGVNFEVRGCCEALTEAVKKVLGNR
jgi:hypothetical protein